MMHITTAVVVKTFPGLCILKKNCMKSYNLDTSEDRRHAQIMKWLFQMWYAWTKILKTTKSNSAVIFQLNAFDKVEVDSILKLQQEYFTTIAFLESFIVYTKTPLWRKNCKIETRRHEVTQIFQHIIGEYISETWMGGYLYKYKWLELDFAFSREHNFTI